MGLVFLISFIFFTKKKNSNKLYIIKLKSKLAFWLITYHKDPVDIKDMSIVSATSSIDIFYEIRACMQFLEF